MPFDYDAAVKAGATPEEINSYLADKVGFDYAAARGAGANDDEIFAHLSSKEANNQGPPSGTAFDALEGKPEGGGLVEQAFREEQAKGGADNQYGVFDKGPRNEGWLDKPLTGEEAVTEYVKKPLKSFAGSMRVLGNRALMPGALEVDAETGNNDAESQRQALVNIAQDYKEEQAPSEKIGKLGRFGIGLENIAPWMAANLVPGLGAPATAGMIADAFTQGQISSERSGQDPVTAALRGIKGGVETAAMMGIPLAGGSVLGTVGRGVGAGVGFGVGGQLADKGILSARGYDAEAAAINPLDPEALGEAVATQLLFAGHQYHGMRKGAKILDANLNALLDSGDITHTQAFEAIKASGLPDTFQSPIIDSIEQRRVTDAKSVDEAIAVANSVVDTPTAKPVEFSDEEKASNLAEAAARLNELEALPTLSNKEKAELNFLRLFSEDHDEVAGAYGKKPAVVESSPEALSSEATVLPKQEELTRDAGVDVMGRVNRPYEEAIPRETPEGAGIPVRESDSVLAKQAELSPEQKRAERQAEYQELFDNAANEEARQKVQNSYAKQLTADVVNADPVYQDMADARRRGGLNLAEFGTDYDKDTVNLINKRYPGIFSRNGKVSPDDFANEKGYSNLDDMVRRFSDAKTKKELTGQHLEESQMLDEAGKAAQAIYEKEGIDLGPAKNMRVGDLNTGDKVVVEGKNGIPDLVTVKGIADDGTATLKDGVTIEAKPDDVIPAMGIKALNEPADFESRMRDHAAFGDTSVKEGTGVAPKESVRAFLDRKKLEGKERKDFSKGELAFPAGKESAREFIDRKKEEKQADKQEEKQAIDQTEQKEEAAQLPSEYTKEQLESTDVTLKGLNPRTNKIEEYTEKASKAISDIDEEIGLYEKLRKCVGA